jgi:general secretion pathway protein D
VLILALSGCAAQKHHRAGLAAMDNEDFGTAIRELRTATDLEPDNQEFRRDWLRLREQATAKLLERAERAIADGQHEEAATHYRELLSFDRNHQRAKAGLDRIGRITSANEDVAEAKKAMRRGEFPLASSLARRALDVVPEHADALTMKLEIDRMQAREVIGAQGLDALYKKPINLEFRDASLKSVFEALSRTTGINFIFDRDVKGDLKTTVFLKHTPLEDAIDVVLTTNQLDKKVLNSRSVLIYPNNAAKTKEYQDLIVRAFYLSHMEAKQGAQMLRTVLKLKEVFVDDKRNMLVLRETPETITLAERLIGLIDLEDPEVMLEVAVLEVNRSRLLNLGIQLTDQITVAPLGGMESPAGGGAGLVTRTFKLSDLSKQNRDTLGITVPSATLNLQKRDGDANLLANPRIRVRDREKAKVMIGDKIPVVTTTSTPNGFVAESIQYLDVGLKLEAEPTIYLRDEVGLKLSLEVSSLVSSIKTNSGSLAFQIGSRNYNSTLRLKDGETQIIAGLISDEERSSANRFPLVGDLPILGRFFSSQGNNRQKTEIIMSITPRLIRSVRRNDPSAESFWSGTEASLRTRPLALRTTEPERGGAGDAATRPRKTPVAPAAHNQVEPRSSNPAAAIAASSNSVLAKWEGPTEGRVGQHLTVALTLESAEALRAMPVQLAFDPGKVQVLNVYAGEFFGTGEKLTFGHSLDAEGGRISASGATAEVAGAAGRGKFLMVEMKPLTAGTEVELILLQAAPVGAGKAVDRPLVPVVHRIAVTH